MKKNKNPQIICPICGSLMNEYEYAYDNHEYGKIYYKCPVCGHKTNIVT